MGNTGKFLTLSNFLLTPFAFRVIIHQQPRPLPCFRKTILGSTSVQYMPLTIEQSASFRRGHGNSRLDEKCRIPVHLKRGKDEKRYLNDSHLQSFHWLVYSAAQKGLFCKYCPLFVTGASGGLKRQVPLKSWSQSLSQNLLSYWENMET